MESFKSEEEPAREATGVKTFVHGGVAMPGSRQPEAGTTAAPQCLDMPKAKARLVQSRVQMTAGIAPAAAARAWCHGHGLLIAVKLFNLQFHLQEQHANVHLAIAAS